MGWFRSYFALINKNRLIKSRQWCSTIAEILLPVLIFCIFVGLRAAVKKSEHEADAHLDAFVRWDPQTVATLISISDSKDNKGTSGVETIQFVGPSTNPIIDQAMNAFKLEFPQLAPSVQHRFESDEELDKYVGGDTYASSSIDSSVYMAISILSTGNNNSPLSSNNLWEYSIRGNLSDDVAASSTLFTPNSLVNKLQIEYDILPFQVLGLRGHLLLQDFMDRFIITNHTGNSNHSAFALRNYAYQPFPTPAYISDPFADTIANFIGLFFTIIYIWPVTRLVKGIVEEKQLRIKEGMLQMGLPNSALFCSWITTYGIIFIMTSIGIVIVTAFNVYEHSNKGYIFLFFFFFAMTTFSFCWLLSVFFSRAQVATTVAALAFLALFFIYCKSHLFYLLLTPAYAHIFVYELTLVFCL
jgi:hypothetical protein